MSGVDLSTLNEAQRTIATTLDDALFVEAGAGSGKTFTLTRRIAWALSPGSGTDGKPFLDSLDQVLVITFTNAAAQEIRERVRSTLRDAGMHDAALSVDSAWISTIHGMCSRILKRNALDLGLDPSFGVASSHRQDELMTIAVEQAVGVARRMARPGSLEAQAFEELNYHGVVSRVQALVSAAHAATDGFDSLWLPDGGDIASAMEDLQRAYEALGSRKLSAKAKEAVTASLEALQTFTSLAPGERTPARAQDVLAQCRMPRKSNAIADMHAETKAELDRAKILVPLERARQFAPYLMYLARRTEEQYDLIKRKLSLLDNDDLVSLALRAIEGNPTVAKRYAGRFRLVMVDEFQDTDEKQLRLISLLAGGNGEDDPQHLATVGDAQQSIYRFRGADVAVFNARGRRVDVQGHVRLDVNYRSHADILAFVDKVCGGPRGVLDGFMHLDASPTRKDGYLAKPLPRIAIEIASMQGRSTAPMISVLAAQVADRLVAYRDAGEKAGNMALLLGSTTHAEVYIDALRARGLECVVTGGSTFTKAPEVAVMLALLRTLANPHDTQSGLFPLLSSEMFELDANDFLQLGSRAQERLDAPTKRAIDRGLEAMTFFHDAPPSARLARAHEVLGRALDSVATRPVADVCVDVLRDSGWLSRLESQGPEGVAREANVLAAVRYIRDLTQELGLGPVRAAAEFAHWLEVSKVPPASLAGAEQDTVRIMTIHASKGLEYPVVAVAECWKNPRQDSGVWSAPADDGRREVIIAPPQLDTKLLDSLPDSVLSGDLAEHALMVRQRNREADEQEKARLLYVALTRAREALVLAVDARVSKQDGITAKLVAGTFGALFNGFAEDLKMPETGSGLLAYGGSEPALVRHIQVTDDGLEGDEDGTFASLAAGTDEERREVALYDSEPCACEEAVVLRAREDVFSYSSALAGKAFAQPASDTKVRVGRQPMPKLAPREEREAEAAGEPTSSDEDKATNLGSAFHQLAQVMVETGAEVTRRRFESTCLRWGLSDRQRARLRAALDRWTVSDLREEALGYGLLRAEVPFFVPVTVSQYERYGSYAEGAIDLLCTDGPACAGRALVVDYKTGDVNLTPEEVYARHAPQAKLYADVLLSQGFSEVTCAFICVETGFVARWHLCSSQAG